MVEIKVPIWKTRSVGIASNRLDEDIEITYVDKDGKRLYPDIFKAVGREKGMTYPKDSKKSFLHIIPIADLEVKNE